MEKNHFPNFPLLYDNPLRFELTRKIPPKDQQCPNYSQLRSSHLASLRSYFKNFYNNPDHMINKLPGAVLIIPDLDQNFRIFGDIRTFHDATKNLSTLVIGDDDFRIDHVSPECKKVNYLTFKEKCEEHYDE
ncbi:hypothetical protein RCL1_009065 [Eukaryota sp. TZLM3-RCL]